MFGGSVTLEDPTMTGPPPYLYELSDFDQLLLNPDLERDIVLEGIGRSRSTGFLVPIPFGRGQRFPERVFHRGLGDAVVFETNLFDGSANIGGASVPTAGDIAIEIGDTENDWLCDVNPAGQSLIVLMGKRGAPLDRFQPIFSGTAEGATWTLQRYSIALRDPSLVLDQPVQSHFYLGTTGNTLGGLEGDTDFKGKPVVIAYGRLFNVEPDWVNRFYLVGKFNDGPMKAVNELRDRGIVLTYAGDISTLSLASVFDWVPPPNSGSYITDLANSLIRLSDQPVGIVTGDIEGDNAGGYVNTISQISRRVLTHRLGLPTAALDLAAFSQLDIDQPAEAGIYIQGGARSTIDVLDQLREGILGYLTFTRTGLITIGRIGFGPPVAVLVKEDIESIETVRSELPFWRRRIGYARAYTVQGPNDISWGASDEAKSFAAEEYRLTDDPTGEDATIKADVPSAEDVTVNSCLAQEADAEAEAARQLALFGPQRDRYDLVVKNQQFRLQAGQTVTLIYPRFGLQFGKQFVIRGLGENSTTQRTSLRLWGGGVEL